MVRSLFIAVVTVFAGVAAQDTHAIRGTVVDSTGWVIPGVTITLTAAARTASAVTNSRGRYEITGLASGPYHVSATLPGFNTPSRDVTLSSRDETVDFTLTVGGPPAAPNDPRRIYLEANEAKWRAAAVKNYEFRIDVRCFCGIPASRPWLRVVNGVPVAPDDVDAATKGFFSHYNTVEKLFSVIRNALDHGGEVVDVTYDAETGFPVVASLDPVLTTSDDEMYFRVELKLGGRTSGNP